MTRELDLTELDYILKDAQFCGCSCGCKHEAAREQLEEWAIKNMGTMLAKYREMEEALTKVCVCYESTDGHWPTCAYHYCGSNGCENPRCHDDFKED